MAGHDGHLVTRTISSLHCLPALRQLDAGRVWLSDGLLQPLARVTQLRSLSVALKRVAHAQLAVVSALTQLTALAVVQSQPVNHTSSDMVRGCAPHACAAAVAA